MPGRRSAVPRSDALPEEAVRWSACRPRARVAAAARYRLRGRSGHGARRYRPSLRPRRRVSRVARPSLQVLKSCRDGQPDPWVVHKFGGSSVADADCFRKRGGHPRSRCRPPAWPWCCPPARGVTDALLRLVALAERQDDSYRVELARCARATRRSPRRCCSAPSPRGSISRASTATARTFEGILHAVKLTRAAAQQRERSHRRLRGDLVHAAVPSLL